MEVFLATINVCFGYIVRSWQVTAKATAAYKMFHRSCRLRSYRSIQGQQQKYRLRIIVLKALKSVDHDVFDVDSVEMVELRDFDPFS
ncbi:hypothetical protein L596_017697 [Steinernema carpocapsae]|uniref:Uncharacterized protein n=1 Tax=Steinernema carpocapsae TaxID=34508 RepID=A0A4U5N2E6_STECR|nr:hypothetical protein L596_017697 [Steinernema carpocapsae]